VKEKREKHRITKKHIKIDRQIEGKHRMAEKEKRER
jgi:hypothetical protein